MASTFIAVNHRSGSPALKAYTNGTPATLGTTFGAADSLSGLGTAGNNFMNNAGFCYFLGSFYALVGGHIYKATDLTATSWSSVYTINTSNLATTIQVENSGLQVVFNAGAPMMVVIYGNGGTHAAAWSTDGSSWTETSTVNATAAYVPFNTPLIYHGKLYVYTFGNESSTTGAWIVFDPASKTISFFNQTFSTSDDAAAMAVCQDRIFHQQISGTTLTLYELSGSTVLSRATIRTSATPMNIQGKSLIWTDGTYLYSLYWVSVGTGWEVKQITLDTWSMTDYTSVVPAAMLGSASPPNTGRVGMITDGVGSPGATPSRFIYYAVDGAAATAWSVFKWNGTGSAMTFVDSGGSAADAMPFYTQVDGDVFFSAGQNKIEITARTPVSGGVRYSFKIWGSGTVAIRAWFSSATQDAPTSAATLANPSAGVLSGNTVTGLTADGTTTYQVDWKAATDGFATGDFPKLLLEQF